MCSPISGNTGQIGTNGKQRYIQYMGSKRVDVIGQSSIGLIGCHGRDSIPLLGPSPRGDNAWSTPSACGHCLSSKSSVSEYIRLTFSDGQPNIPSFSFHHFYYVSWQQHQWQQQWQRCRENQLEVHHIA